MEKQLFSENIKNRNGYNVLVQPEKDYYYDYNVLVKTEKCYYYASEKVNKDILGIVKADSYSINEYKKGYTSSLIVIGDKRNLPIIYPFLLETYKKFIIVEVSATETAEQINNEDYPNLTGWNEVEIKRVVPVEEYNQFFGKFLNFDEKGRCTFYFNEMENTSFIKEWDEKNRNVDLRILHENEFVEERIIAYDSLDREIKRIIRRPTEIITTTHEYF